MRLPATEADESGVRVLRVFALFGDERDNAAAQGSHTTALERENELLRQELAQTQQSCHEGPFGWVRVTSQ